jgi:uncharacterized glyoxalase superfamily protein PhnB
MPIRSLTPILNVTNITSSVEWFQLFGWRRGFAWNSGGMISHGMPENEHGPATFASVCIEDVEIFLCVGAQGSRGSIVPKFPGDDETDGVWMSWWVGSPEEVDQFFEIATVNKCEVSYPPTDEPWGVREMHLRHPDGHTFRVSSGLKG